MNHKAKKEFIAKVRAMKTEELPALFAALKADNSVPFGAVMFVSKEYEKRIHNRATGKVGQ